MYMKKILIILLIGFMVLSGLNSCDKNPLQPDQIFTRIYDDPNSDISYYPLDIKQDDKGGYFILGATALDTTRTWVLPVILYTSSEGDIIWRSDIQKPYVNPVSNLMEIGGEFYFFCMDDLSLGTYLMKINPADTSAIEVASLSNYTYPLAASKTPDNGFLLLSYNRLQRHSALSKISLSGAVQWNSIFSVIEDAEPFLIDHLIKKGKNLNFFTGTIGEPSARNFFANGLFNYTLSMLFVNTSGVRTGVAQGFRYNGGAVSALSLADGSFAITRQSFGEHFILPSVAINVNSITTTSNLGGAKLAEIDPDSETRILRMNSNNRSLLIFAASTNNNQIVLYVYDAVSFELINKKYLGFANQLRIASIIKTKDEGVAVLGQTMVTGRFKRMCLFKLPKEQL
jgi:hypothetical protein